MDDGVYQEVIRGDSSWTLVSEIDRIQFRNFPKSPRRPVPARRSSRGRPSRRRSGAPGAIRSGRSSSGSWLGAGYGIDEAIPIGAGAVPERAPILGRDVRQVLKRASTIGTGGL